MQRVPDVSRHVLEVGGSIDAPNHSDIRALERRVVASGGSVLRVPQVDIVAVLVVTGSLGIDNHPSVNQQSSAAADTQPGHGGGIQNGASLPGGHGLIPGHSAGRDICRRAGANCLNKVSLNGIGDDHFHILGVSLKRSLFRGNVKGCPRD